MKTSQILEIVNDRLGNNTSITKSTLYAYRREGLIPPHMCQKKSNQRLSWTPEAAKWAIVTKTMLDSDRNATRVEVKLILDSTIPEVLNDISALLDLQQEYPRYQDLVDQLRSLGMDPAIAPS